MKRILPTTQSSRAKQEMRALTDAEKKGITEAEIIMEMQQDMKNPNSAESVMEAASSITYIKAVRDGHNPIKDAVDRLKKRPSGAPSGAPEPA